MMVSKSLFSMTMLVLLIARVGFATPVLYSFSGTVTDSGGTIFAVGDHITGTFVTDDQALGSNGNTSAYPLVSASVMLPLGITLPSDNLAGGVSVSNNLQGLDQFNLSASLWLNLVNIVTQDDQGTIFASEELPLSSIPMSEFEVARLEISLFEDGPWGTCSFPTTPAGFCGVYASLDALTPSLPSSTTISVPPAGTEAITRSVNGFDDFLYTQEQDALQVIVSADQINYEARRAFLEFTVPDLPGFQDATLVINKYYDADSGTNPILVSVYDPGMSITLDTYNIPTTPFAFLPTNQVLQQESVRLDISPVVSAHRGSRLGLRLSVNDEGTPGISEFPIFTGAAFDDGYLGTPPKIEINTLLASTSSPAPTPIGTASLELSAPLPDGSATPVTVSFANVTGEGQTWVTTSTNGPPPPNGFQLGTDVVYYDVSTTATFAGNIDLCFSWTEGTFGDEQTVRLFHYDNDVWVDVTTSVDTSANIVCGSVTSLSPFAAAEVAVNNPPHADAGTDVQANEGESILLDGSASNDDDGDSINYSWTQLSGPTAVGFAGAETATPVVQIPAVGGGGATMTFQLTVCDPQGLCASDSVNVVIKKINHPPVASLVAESPVTVDAPNVLLNGSGSYDPDLDALSYTWEQTSGAPVALDLTDIKKPVFTAPSSPQVLDFQLTVSDGQLSSQATVSISVVAANQAPMANAGASQTVAYGAQVTLTGSATDADGDVLTYTWSQTAGPAVTLSDPMILTPSFEAPSTTTVLTFALVANDGKVDSAAASVDVLVFPTEAIPNCDNAHANREQLWPPNRTMSRVKIRGMQALKMREGAEHDNHECDDCREDDSDDPDEDLGLVSIHVTSIAQDEPTTGTGSGDQPVDAVVESVRRNGEARLRDLILLKKERKDSGDGRIYQINFTATNTLSGASCEGAVQVCVPTKKGKEGKCVDSGQSYDSFN